MSTIFSGMKAFTHGMLFHTQVDDEMMLELLTQCECFHSECEYSCWEKSTPLVFFVFLYDFDTANKRIIQRVMIDGATMSFVKEN